MRINDRISIVGGGKWSFGISHVIDCSIYAIETGDGIIMIDSGCGLESERIESNMARSGLSISDVKVLILTHYHADHACGSKWIREKSGCAVYTSGPESRCIAEGDDVASSLAPNRGRSYPADFVYPACPDVKGLYDGDRVSLGDVTLTAFTVPGHSLCDLAVYGRIGDSNCLFSGDAVFAGGEILLQSLYDVSILPYYDGIRKLAALDVDALFPGHGQFVLEDGGWHVRQCLEGFESGLVPKQFHYFR